MIALGLPEPYLWALRWALFIGPGVALLVLLRLRRPDPRQQVGCLFAFLYGLGLIFPTHLLAIALGWWRYGGDILMLQGIPADVWIGGALLFGPVLYLAFPTIAPLMLALPIIIGAHGLFFASLPPLVYSGPGWFGGVVLVFAVAHIPAIYLARWTAEGRLLPARAALLALGYGFLAFLILPSLIMAAMGGSWLLAERPLWLLQSCAILLGLLFVIGLSAVQVFVLYGDGTPIPLDPTKRLVRSGIFAYLSNPMQLSTAAAWVVIGAALGSVWVASAAIMAWVFVQGIVRWHHRNDLLLRFPEDWTEYRAHVPEWRPRWRPWVPEPSLLVFDPQRPFHRRLAAWLEPRATGLRLEPRIGAPLAYADERLRLGGLTAAAKALDHVNFAWMIVSAALLLVLMPLDHLRSAICPRLNRIKAESHA